MDEASAFCVVCGGTVASERPRGSQERMRQVRVVQRDTGGE